jgi:hypothetical protein
MRDKKNKPQFTVNEARMVRRCLEHNRCGLCGEKLGEVIYFAGGPAAAFHPNGAYLDPPMHHECITYAIQVCPFLAFPKYMGAKATYVLEMEGVTEDVEAMKGKPDIFCVKASKGFVNMSTWQKPRLVPTSDEGVEFWKDGKQLDMAEDFELIEKAIEDALGVTEDLHSAGATPTTGPIVSSVSALAIATQRR